MSELEFTPLEFETIFEGIFDALSSGLEFTPLEFETKLLSMILTRQGIRIYSVGV